MATYNAPFSLNDDLYWVKFYKNRRNASRPIVQIRCQKNGIKEICFADSGVKIGDGSGNFDELGNRCACLSVEDAYAFIRKNHPDADVLDGVVVDVIDEDA